MAITISPTFTGAVGTRIVFPPNRGPNWFKRLWISFQESRRRERDYQYLMELPDYILDDIGVDRRAIRHKQNRHLKSLRGWYS